VQVKASPDGGFVIDRLILSAPEPAPGKRIDVFDIRRPGAVLTVGRCEGLHVADDGRNRLIAYDEGATPDNTHVTLGPGCALEPGPGGTAVAAARPLERAMSAPKAAVVPAATSSQPSIPVDDALPQGLAATPDLPATVLSKTRLRDGSGNGVITITTPSIASALGVPLRTQLIDKPVAVPGGFEYPVKH
jgi:hypothetical protein